MWQIKCHAPTGLYFEKLSQLTQCFCAEGKELNVFICSCYWNLCTFLYTLLSLCFEAVSLVGEIRSYRLGTWGLDSDNRLFYLVLPKLIANISILWVFSLGNGKVYLQQVHVVLSILWVSEAKGSPCASCGAGTLSHRHLLLKMHASAGSGAWKSGCYD